MAKHFVANTLEPRDRSRHPGARGARLLHGHARWPRCTLQARWARFADGADEVHQMRIAQRSIAAYTDEGSTRRATGDLPI